MNERVLNDFIKDEKIARVEKCFVIQIICVPNLNWHSDLDEIIFNIFFYIFNYFVFQLYVHLIYDKADYNMTGL